MTYDRGVKLETTLDAVEAAGGRLIARDGRVSGYQLPDGAVLEHFDGSGSTERSGWTRWASLDACPRDWARGVSA
jgi:hypothetical protein